MESVLQQNGCLPHSPSLLCADHWDRGVQRHDTLMTLTGVNRGTTNENATNAPVGDGFQVPYKCSFVHEAAASLFQTPPLAASPLPPAAATEKGPEAVSETCCFCHKRVYLMERLSAEGLFFHRSCFRCDYCQGSLRLGNYAYDRTTPFKGQYVGRARGLVNAGPSLTRSGAVAGVAWHHIDLIGCRTMSCCRITVSHEGMSRDDLSHVPM